MKLFLYLFLNMLIVGLFLYSKLLPYKSQLDPSYAGVFGFFNNLFTPILNFLRGMVKPFQVGLGLSVDMTQIILLLVLLLSLSFFR